MPKKYPTEWAKQHDAHAWLLPFDYKVNDPWDVLLDARDYFDQLHTFAATWEWGDLEYQKIATVEKMHDKLAILLGSYRIDNTQNGQKMVNPQYPHDTPRHPVEDFETHLRIAASTGVVSALEVGRRYDMDNPRVWTRLDQCDISYSELRKRGQKRVANSIEIAHEWTGRPYTEFARALGRETRHVRRLRQKHATIEAIPPKPHGRWRNYKRGEA
jgi:hypothetical protein